MRSCNVRPTFLTVAILAVFLLAACGDGTPFESKPAPGTASTAPAPSPAPAPASAGQPAPTPAGQPAPAPAGQPAPTPAGQPAPAAVPSGTGAAIAVSFPPSLGPADAPVVMEEFADFQ